MKIKRKSGDEPEIPTASMADIAFLLIVFFMLTSVFAETMGINYQIPPKSEEEEQATEREQAVSIRIDAAGQVYADQTPIDAGHMRKELSGYLKPKLINWPEKPILIIAEEASPYGKFVEVYDALRRVETEFRNTPEVRQKGFKDLKLQIPSLTEIKRLKEQFGAEIFG